MQTLERKKITPQSTMAEILEAYPAAQRALFARYHMGGCSSCGFSPSDTLEQVLKTKGVEDASEAIALVKEAQTAADTLQITPKELEALLSKSKDGVRLVDVRTEPEHKMVHLDGDRLADESLVMEILNDWPKETPIVLYCHHGNRSLDAAMSLKAQGFTNVKSLQGGIDAWSLEVDSLTPRY